MKRLAVFLLLAVLLVGCGPVEEPQETKPQGWVMPESLYQPEDFVLVGFKETEYERYR